MHNMDTQDFAVYRIGDGTEQSGINRHIDKKGFYKIVWTMEDNGNCRADNETGQTMASHMHCIRAGSCLPFDLPASSGGYIVLLGHRFINEHYGNARHISPCQFHQFFESNPVLTVKSFVAGPMYDALRSFIHASGHPSLLHPDMQSRHMRRFLFYFQQHLPGLKLSAAKPGSSNLAQRYLRLVDEQYVKKKAVCQYAGMLYVTASYLNKVVKEETGLTAREHIQQKIIAEAKRGLYLSGLSMKEVAFSLGFDDIAHFSKFFKKVCGYNFSDLKKNMASEMASTTVVNRFFELLRHHYTTKKRVSDYARLLYLSSNHLNYIIKKYSGHPVSYHISRQLINEATRQALYTDKNMKEIAFDLGFDENTHFSKFFKKVHGCTFSVVRKNRPVSAVQQSGCLQ